MKKALLCLVILAFAVVTASATNNPTLSISPTPIGVHVSGTQIFTAAFSDGSHIQSCTWMATGPLNAVVSIGPNSAVFAAGTLRATYVVTATCTNDAGQQAMGIGIVGVI